VEGEIATATREVPRFAAGGKGSGGGGPSEVAARLASRQRLATKYSRFEAEVCRGSSLLQVAGSKCVCVRSKTGSALGYQALVCFVTVSGFARGSCWLLGYKVQQVCGRCVSWGLAVYGILNPEGAGTCERGGGGCLLTHDSLANPAAGPTRQRGQVWGGGCQWLQRQQVVGRGASWGLDCCRCSGHKAGLRQRWDLGPSCFKRSVVERGAKGVKSPHDLCPHTTMGEPPQLFGGGGGEANPDRCSTRSSCCMWVGGATGWLPC
jgi:hypothetical protein